MKIFVKPTKKGVTIHKPDMTTLSPDGEYVTDDGFWQRRIRDKEVEVVKNPPKIDEKKG